MDPAGLTVASAAGDLRAVTRVFADPWDAARAWIWCRVENRGAAPADVNLAADGVLTARPSSPHRKQAPHPDRRWLVRFADATGGAELVARSPAGDRLSVLSSACPAPLAAGRDGWTWRSRVVVPAAGAADAWICLSVGEAAVPGAAPDAWRAAEDRARRWERAVRVAGPDSSVRDGLAWGMVNSDRVLHRFRGGFGFTNDPPGSIIVTRDIAWFTFGADWYAPDEVREMLDTLVRAAPYASGKIAEYVDLNEAVPQRHDYGLNIADPTPLFLLAVAHHAFATRDAAWLRSVYPVAAAAARYLVSQTRDGLVYCDSDVDAPGSGQCGWRNILIGIRITGAVTELQAESIAALRRAAEMAGAVGDAEAADEWRAAASRMEIALVDHLVDPSTGRYRLAWDPRGAAGAYGADDTIDQVFPALLGVGPEEAAERSVRRVVQPDYRAAWGLRTVPSGAPGGDPRAQVGLVGGTWPNACAWAAAALARFDPDAAAGLAAEVGRTIRPGGCWEAGAWVPGQFGEWFDGETGEALGMALSPWMPPTYVWLVLEGLVGIHAGPAGLSVRPRLPASWMPCAVWGVRVGGATIDLVIDADAVYATGALADCDRPVVRAVAVEEGARAGNASIRVRD